MESFQIKAVPTNIITGFLGVGKSSAILHLLNQKPKQQRWAILVNEFGEIGVDASLLAGQNSHVSGVHIREVPGGCMCCAAGLPMQIALNELLIRAKPDRLLIEPTGLGHPKEILQVLSAEHYQEIIALQKVLTLVDARKLSDTRYTSHETFQQQIAIADLVIGNKTDLYRDIDKSMLEAYVSQYGANDVEIVFTEGGQIPVARLEGATAAFNQVEHHSHEETISAPLLSELPIPECGYVKASNQGEGFESIGWRFSAKHIFQHQKLYSLLSGIKAERMKAVFITENGIFAYNLTSDALTEIELDDCMESRIEVIDSHINDDWESALMACLI